MPGLSVNVLLAFAASCTALPRRLADIRYVPKKLQADIMELESATAAAKEVGDLERDNKKCCLCEGVDYGNAAAENKCTVETTRRGSGLSANVGYKSCSVACPDASPALTSFMKKEKECSAVENKLFKNALACEDAEKVFAIKNQQALKPSVEAARQLTLRNIAGRASHLASDGSDKIAIKTAAYLGEAPLMLPVDSTTCPRTARSRGRLFTVKYVDENDELVSGSTAKEQPKEKINAFLRDSAYNSWFEAGFSSADIQRLGGEYDSTMIQGLKLIDASVEDASGFPGEVARAFRMSKFANGIRGACEVDVYNSGARAAAGLNTQLGQGVQASPSRFQMSNQRVLEAQWDGEPLTHDAMCSRLYDAGKKVAESGAGVCFSLAAMGYWWMKTYYQGPAIRWELTTNGANHVFGLIGRQGPSARIPLPNDPDPVDWTRPPKKKCGRVERRKACVYNRPPSKNTWGDDWFAFDPWIAALGHDLIYTPSDFLPGAQLPSDNQKRHMAFLLKFKREKKNKVTEKVEIKSDRPWVMLECTVGRGTVDPRDGRSVPS